MCDDHDRVSPQICVLARDVLRITPFSNRVDILGRNDMIPAARRYHRGTKKVNTEWQKSLRHEKQRIAKIAVLHNLAVLCCYSLYFTCASYVYMSQAELPCSCFPTENKYSFVVNFQLEDDSIVDNDDYCMAKYG